MSSPSTSQTSDNSSSDIWKPNPGWISRLPAEIQYKIYEYAIDPDQELDNHKVDVSMAVDRKRDSRKMKFKTAFPEAISNIQGLIDAYPTWLGESIDSFLASTYTFTTKHSSSIAKMPELFGQDNCNKINKFEIRFEFAAKVYDQSTWPDLLHLFVNKLPNLSSLTIYSEWGVNAPPYPERESRDPAGSITKTDQEKRAKLRFMTFLLHNHPNLDLLICPARSGHVPVRIPGRSYYHSLIAEKYDAKYGRKWQKHQLGTDPVLEEDILWTEIEDLDDLDEDGAPTLIRIPEYLVAEPVPGDILEDEVVNCTMLTRLTWAEFRNLDHNSIFIRTQGQSKDSISTSLPNDSESSAYARVAERGYQLKETYKQNGWKHSPFVDDLITGTRRHLANLQTNTATGQRGRAGVRSRGHKNRGRGGRGGRGQPFTLAIRGRGMGHRGGRGN